MTLFPKILIGSMWVTAVYFAIAGNWGWALSGLYGGSWIYADAKRMEYLNKIDELVALLDRRERKEAA